MSTRLGLLNFAMIWLVAGCAMVAPQENGAADNGVTRDAGHDLEARDLGLPDRSEEPDLGGDIDLAAGDLTLTRDLAPLPDLTQRPDLAGVCKVLDCANPGCLASCVADPPVGWTGWYTLYDGAPANDPGCTAAFPTSFYQGNNNLSTPPAMCAACSCGATTGATCGPPAGFFVQDAACNGNPSCSTNPTPVAANWDGTCFTGMSYLGGGHTTCGPQADAMCSTNTGAPCNVAITVQALAVKGGSCAPSGGATTRPPLTWMGLGSACSGATSVTTGCNLGQHCLAKPLPPSVSGVCVSAAGAKACPPGPFSAQHIFYTGVIDSRSCSACACSAPTGIKCTGSMTFYSSNIVNNCAGVIATIAVDSVSGGCASIANNPNVAGRKLSLNPPGGGACAPAGGQPAGTVTADPATATTFCCVP